MKKLVIVYGAPLTQVQGVNYVNDSFIRGKQYFRENGIEFEAIVSNEEVFDCTKHDCLDKIGASKPKFTFMKESRLRRTLKDNFILRSLLRLFKSFLLPSKKAAKRYISSGINADFLLFQGSFAAYYFFKYGGDMCNKTKIVIMDHSDGVPYSMLRPQLKGLFRYPFLAKALLINKDKLVYERMDKIVFLSSKAVEAAQHIPTSKKTYIFNGIEDLPQVTLKKHLDDKIQFVCVGSMNYRKGQDLIVEALNRLPDEITKKIHFHFVGFGPQMNVISKYVHNHQLDEYVTFWGVRNDVPDILKNMDVFMLPSSSEGMPMSIIEAERQGLYIVATDTGGIKEMISEDFGTIIDRSISAIAETITDIVVNNRITPEVREASRNFYLNHLSLKNNINTFSKMFLSL